MGIQDLYRRGGVAGSRKHGDESRPPCWKKPAAGAVLGNDYRMLCAAKASKKDGASRRETAEKL
jgi:hypothetical protein